jgi:hypothetical protein
MRPRLVRSTVLVGGGRSPVSLGRLARHDLNATFDTVLGSAYRWLHRGYFVFQECSDD